jgi:hypothetical protein
VTADTPGAPMSPELSLWCTCARVPAGRRSQDVRHVAFVVFLSGRPVRARAERRVEEGVSCTH